MKTQTRFASLSLPLILSLTLAVVPSSATDNTGNTGKVSLPAQDSLPTPQSGHVYIPESSKEQPEGHAHTTLVMYSLDGSNPVRLDSPAALEVPGPLSTVQMAETPQSLGCLYVSSPQPRSSGCIPNYASGSGGPSLAGYGAIAVIEAYDNPTANSDLNAFDSYWGLQPMTATKVYATGPPTGCPTGPPPLPPPGLRGWAVESSLDIEWAHVFAPRAQILLVEACTQNLNDLVWAEQVAFNYIVAHYPAGGQVSNSWQWPEFSGQIADDSFFADFAYNGLTGWNTHILAFASSGDSGFGVGYPATNPWVVAAGGTSVLRDSVTHKVTSESCWGGSGGGTSAFETYATSWTGGNMGPWANYQYPIFGQSNRLNPDLSFDADPASGVYVYSSYGAGGWTVVGGTSVSSPALASIVNRAGNKLGSVFLTPIGDDYFSNFENNLLYSQLATATAYPTNFYDVKTGSNGSSAVANWDYCTGVGTPRDLLGK
jgi:kumamolisin